MSVHQLRLESWITWNVDAQQMGFASFVAFLKARFPVNSKFYFLDFPFFENVGSYSQSIFSIVWFSRFPRMWNHRDIDFLVNEIFRYSDSVALAGHSRAKPEKTPKAKLSLCLHLTQCSKALLSQTDLMYTHTSKLQLFQNESCSRAQTRLQCQEEILHAKSNKNIIKT